MRLEKEVEALVAERDALKAKLAALQAQEPELWIGFDGVRYSYWGSQVGAECDSQDDWSPIPLYRAAGAKEKTE